MLGSKIQEAKRINIENKSEIKLIKNSLYFYEHFQFCIIQPVMTMALYKTRSFDHSHAT